MKDLRDDEVRQAVRKTYADIANAGSSGYNCVPSTCCGEAQDSSAQGISVKMGYSEDDVTAVPEGANMGLGCGNPQAIASLRPGETVLDLGSGGGFDCFLAARSVGPDGHVIGVDMTPDMISKARENAAKSEVRNIEFRLGEIEHLPVADGSVDVIISNCVINLSPDKPKVYEEIFRALKSGGRLAVTDVVATAPLPDDVRKDLELHAGCVAGASQIDEIESMLKQAGFANIRVKPIDASRKLIREWAQDKPVVDFIVSATIEAKKP
ncbi:MAG: arsenite methyltransferase [Planctomycetota bacterium]|jgi:SAM-dependent methyltransferase